MKKHGALIITLAVLIAPLANAQSAENPAEPRELVLLRSQCDHEVAAAAKPIMAQFDQQMATATKPILVKYERLLQRLENDLIVNRRLAEALAVSQERKRMLERIDPSAKSGQQKNGAITVCVSDYRDITESDETPEMDIAATSQTPGYERSFISDGNKKTGFAFLGPTGTLDLTFSQEVTPVRVIIIGRIGYDADIVNKGVLTINKTLRFGIKDFDNKKMVVIENPYRLPVHSISFESVKGVNNPGFNELYFFN